jgi:hypothetical protein
MLIFGEQHLRLALAECKAHYNRGRRHRSRQLHPPRPDFSAADLSQKPIKRRPVLGGLLNEYKRAAQKPRSTLAAEFWNPTGLRQAASSRTREVAWAISSRAGSGGW